MKEKSKEGQIFGSFSYMKGEFIEIILSFLFKITWLANSLHLPNHSPLQFAEGYPDTLRK